MAYYTNTKQDFADVIAEADLEAIETAFADIETDLDAMFGDISTQTLTLGVAMNANNQAITNVDINSGAIDGTTIGAASAAAITCTTLTTSGDVGVGDSPDSGVNLDVNDSTEARVRFQTTGGQIAEFIAGSSGVDMGARSNHMLYLNTNNTRQLTIDTNGNVSASTGTTGMTNGFFFIPAAAGAPSGTPTLGTTTLAAMYYDTTNKKFYCYNHVANAWEGVTLS